MSARPEDDGPCGGNACSFPHTQFCTQCRLERERRAGQPEPNEAAELRLVLNAWKASCYEAERQRNALQQTLDARNAQIETLKRLLAEGIALDDKAPATTESRYWAARARGAL